MWDLVSSMQELHLVILYGMHRANSWLKCDKSENDRAGGILAARRNHPRQASLLEGQQAADVTFKPVVLQLMYYFYTDVDGRSKLVVPEKYRTLPLYVRCMSLHK